MNGSWACCRPSYLLWSHLVPWWVSLLWWFALLPGGSWMWHKQRYGSESVNNPQGPLTKEGNPKRRQINLCWWTHLHILQQKTFDSWTPSDSRRITKLFVFSIHSSQPLPQQHRRYTKIGAPNLELRCVRHLPDPGIEPGSPALQADSSHLSHQGNSKPDV